MTTPELPGLQQAGPNAQYAGPDGRVVPVLTRSGHESTDTTQSGDCVRVSGVSVAHTPATRIWFGQVSNKPGYRSLPHHHGEAETGGYVLSGHGRIYFGANYAQWFDMTNGDWVFVPPYMPHVEANMSITDDLIWLTTRTPENIVINLDEIDDHLLEGFRRV